MRNGKNGNHEQRQYPMQHAPEPFDIKQVEQDIRDEVDRTHSALPTTIEPQTPGPEAYAPTTTPDRQRRAGQLAGEAIAKQYMDTATAIENTGREYLATQMQLAAGLIDQAKQIEEHGQSVMGRYNEVASEYRDRAKQVHADITRAAERSGKAVEFCHQLVDLLNSTQEE